MFRGRLQHSFPSRTTLFHEETQDGKVRPRRRASLPHFFSFSITLWINSFASVKFFITIWISITGRPGQRWLWQ